MAIDRDAFKRRLRSVDWAPLVGAYGPSDRALDGHTSPDGGSSAKYGEDVPATLLSLLDGECDDNVLNEHVLHQGSIYAVTAAVVPFIWELLADEDLDEVIDEAELVEWQWQVHQAALSARYAPHGAAVLDATLRSLSSPRAIRHPELAELIELAVSPWRDEVVARVVGGEAELGARAWAVLATLPAAEALVAHAVTALPELQAIESASDDVTAMALIAARAPSTPDLHTKISIALAPARRRSLEIALSEPPHVWTPAYPHVAPLAAAGAWSPTLDATVLLVGPSLVTLRVAPHGDALAMNASVRLPPGAVVRGQNVRVGLHANTRVRVVEWMSAAGRAERLSFDESGALSR